MDLFELQQNEFRKRHIGPTEKETKRMLAAIGENSLDELIDKTVPPAIRMAEKLAIPDAMSEADYLAHLKEISLQYKVFKNYIARVITIH